MAVGTPWTDSLRAFESYQQLSHRHAPAFIRDVLANFCQGSLTAAAAADELNLSRSRLYALATAYRRARAGKLGSSWSPGRSGGDLGAFRSGGGVAPELCRTDDFAGLVERHEPMLLPADTDRDDFARASLGLLQRHLDRLRRGLTPGVWMLLLRARRQAGDEVIAAGTGAEDLAGPGVHDERLGGLRAGINADE